MGTSSDLASSACEMSTVRFDATYQKFKLNHRNMLKRHEKLENSMQQANLNDYEKNSKRKLLGKRESEFLRQSRFRMGVDSFDTIQVIGRGAFGVIKLVQKKNTGEVFAMKVLKKVEVHRQEQIAHARAERDILARANSQWVVKMFYSFQDLQNLYLVMEFVPGGDLMVLLIKYDILTQEQATFITAECVEALHFIHSLNYIHRDIKPDNILIDDQGHIKLTDFGLCTGLKKSHRTEYYRNSTKFDLKDLNDIHSNSQKVIDNWRSTRRKNAKSLVGTPDYIAPEILLKKPYDKMCDWWAVGVILYEMRVGFAPFCSESPETTYKKIISYKNTLQYPIESDITEIEQDLISCFLEEPESRLGKNINEIREHHYFEQIDFENIRSRPSPIPIKVNGMTDCSNFEPVNEPIFPTDSGWEPDIRGNANDWYCFIDYTFTRAEQLEALNM